jgi:hypothetical protein
MTAQKLKQNLITYLQDNTPDDFAVYDGTQRAEFDLPCLAVEITSSQKHSDALHWIKRAGIEITLRSHPGDDDDIKAWQKQIETLLECPDTMQDLLNEGIRVDYWQYEGAEASFDDVIHETKFSCEALVAPI